MPLFFRNSNSSFPGVGALDNDLAPTGMHEPRVFQHPTSLTEIRQLWRDVCEGELGCGGYVIVLAGDPACRLAKPPVALAPVYRPPYIDAVPYGVC